MRTVNIHEAKTHLSKTWSKRKRGDEAFVIAKAGKPMVRVLDRLHAHSPRTISTPCLADEIVAMFEGRD